MKTLMFSLLTLSVLLSGYLQGQSLSMDQPMGQSAETATDTRTAFFAGGCFWCTEADFEKVPGVVDAISGYTGGKEVNPTYEQVSSHATGHVESVKVIYDPAKVSDDQLIEWFWRHINPTDAGGQFVDRGDQYRSAIFYADPEQQRIATAAKQKLTASGRFDKPIATEILPLGPFYPAEDYHQNYYKKNPIRYHWYRFGSGRDRFIEKVWSADELKFESIKREVIGMQKNMRISSAMPAEMKPETGPMAQNMR
jgi:peptide methionine sulfoxide reductase msrA/msrB